MSRILKTHTKQRMGKIKVMFPKALAACVCVAMVLVLGNMGKPDVSAATKSKLKVKSSVKSKVIDVKGVTKLSVKGIKAGKLKFKSSSKKIAKVSKSGVVKGVKPGKATITVVSKKNKKSKGKIRIKVKNLKPSALTLNHDKLSLQEGAKETLTAKASPAGVYCPVSFSSSSPQNVTVSGKGAVSALKVGSAVITVKSKEKNASGKFITKTVAVDVTAKEAAKKPSVTPKKPADNSKKPNPSTSEDEGKLADGTWYGVAEDGKGYNFDQEGPNIVKVEISNGKIADTDIVKAVVDSGYTKGNDILKFVKGLKSTDDVEKQLNDYKGSAYDTVAGASMTARGHLSAVKNALKRSKKYDKDKIEQKVNYYDFKVRPAGNVSGETLDLSKAVFNVYLKDGKDGKGNKKVEVPYDKLGEYGIKATPAHGSKLPEVGTNFTVNFRSEESLINIPLRLQVQKAYKYCYATHVIVTYENGETQKIDLTEQDFSYTLKAKAEVTKMEIYRGETFLKEAVKQSYGWVFELKGIKTPDGFDLWGFEQYNIKVEPLQDDSPITSFDINTGNLPKSCGVGEKLNLSGLKIKATTQKGTNKEFKNWEECANAGFKAEPGNGYEFMNADVGKKTITISYKAEGGEELKKTFEIEVISKDDFIPARIDIYDDEYNLIKQITVSEEEFKNKGGRLIYPSVEIDKKYEQLWKDGKFTAGAFNKKDAQLQIKYGKKSGMFQIDFLGYKIDEEANAYAMIKFKFV